MLLVLVICLGSYKGLYAHAWLHARNDTNALQIVLEVLYFISLILPLVYVTCCVIWKAIKKGLLHLHVNMVIYSAAEDSLVQRTHNPYVPQFSGYNSLTVEHVDAEATEIKKTSKELQQEKMEQEREWP